MRALCIYLALTAVAANIATNVASRTAAGIERAQEQRIERLCAVNPIYCD